MRRLLFALPLVLLTLMASPVEAGDGCDPDQHRVMFSAIPDVHLRRKPHLRRCVSSDDAKGAQAQCVRLHVGTAKQMLSPALSSIHVSVDAFGTCLPLPELHHVRDGLRGMRIFASQEPEGEPWAHLVVAGADPDHAGPGHDHPLVFITAELPQGHLEVQVARGADPDIGRPYRALLMQSSGAHSRGRKPASLSDRHGGTEEPSLVQDSEPMPPLSLAEKRSIRRYLSGRRLPFSRREPLEIVVGYTRETLIELGSETAIAARATSGCLWFEIALENSGVPREVRLAGVGPTYIRELDHVNAAGVVTTQDLISVAMANSQLRKLRRDHFGDFAILATQKTSLDPIAWGMTWVEQEWWPFGAPGAYSVMHQTVLNKKHVAHECGHNVGCGHVSAFSNAQTWYAHGWQLQADGQYYCTVLGSKALPKGVSCVSERRFSDPDGYLPGGIGPLGTPANDNVRLLERNLRWAAYWGYVIQSPLP